MRLIYIGVQRGGCRAQVGRCHRRLPAPLPRVGIFGRHPQGGGRLRNSERRGLSLENQPFKEKNKVGISLCFNYLCVPIGRGCFSSKIMPKGNSEDKSQGIWGKRII